MKLHNIVHKNDSNKVDELASIIIDNKASAQEIKIVEDNILKEIHSLYEKIQTLDDEYKKDNLKDKIKKNAENIEDKLTKIQNLESKYKTTIDEKILKEIEDLFEKLKLLENDSKKENLQGEITKNSEKIQDILTK